MTQRDITIRLISVRLVPLLLSCWRRRGTNFLGFLEKRHHKCLPCLHGGTHGGVERWNAATRAGHFWGLYKQCHVAARAARASGSPVQALRPNSMPPTFFPSQIMGDEEPWVCRDGPKGRPGDDIKLCRFCFLSQLSWLVPLFASKPAAASPVVSIQALKLFKLFAERCSPSVSSSHA